MSYFYDDTSLLPISADRATELVAVRLSPRAFDELGYKADIAASDLDETDAPAAAMELLEAVETNLATARTRDRAGSWIAKSGVTVVATRRAMDLAGRELANAAQIRSDNAAWYDGADRMRCLADERCYAAASARCREAASNGLAS